MAAYPVMRSYDIKFIFSNVIFYIAGEDYEPLNTTLMLTPGTTITNTTLTILDDDIFELHPEIFWMQMEVQDHPQSQVVTIPNADPKSIQIFDDDREFCWTFYLKLNHTSALVSFSFSVSFSPSFSLSLSLLAHSYLSFAHVFRGVLWIQGSVLYCWRGRK